MNLNVTDRETKEYINSGHIIRHGYESAVRHLSKNPEATVCINDLIDRVWVCTTTGKIRTDKHDDLIAHLKVESQD